MSLILLCKGPRNIGFCFVLVCFFDELKIYDLILCVHFIFGLFTFQDYVSLYLYLKAICCVPHSPTSLYPLYRNSQKDFWEDLLMLGREREKWRETLLRCSTYLCIHWLILTCPQPSIQLTTLVNLDEALTNWAKQSGCNSQRVLGQVYLKKTI